MTITPATELFGVNILPTPYHVLGQDLLPFSVGHALLFSKLGVTHIATADDLILAVLVCCHRYEDFESNLERPWFKWRLKWWGWQCKQALKVKGRFETAIKAFQEYLTEGTSQPDYDLTASSRGGAADSKTPFLQHLRTVLLAKLNYTPSELLNTPYSQAIWDYRAYMEMEGAIVITDGRPGENTAALFENADERIAEAIKRHEELHRRN